MTLWLARAGQHGEHEAKFLNTGKIYLTWSGLRRDLSQLATKQALQQVLRETYPDAGKGRIINHSGQIWTFTHEMRPGDWVVVPSKRKPAIHIAEITGPYEFDPTADAPYFHSRA
jgi:restriction system protein